MNVTVVVPVHNNSSTLKRVIAPLKKELLPGDRILAVDDRSVDNSCSILSELEIETVASSGKPGAAGTRNTGGFLAKTDWILFVDADAVAPEGWREHLSRRSGGVQAVQAVYSRNAVGKSAATFYKNYYYFHTFTRRIRGPYIKGCGTFFFAVEADVFGKLKGFDENIAGATIEDADFAERLWASGGRIIIAPEIEVFHLREYTTNELFRYEWNMMKAKALYILRRDGSRGAPSISVAGFREMIPVLSGALFSWVFIIGVLLWATGVSQGVFIAAAGLLVTGAGQASFKYHAAHDGGFRGVRACLFILPDLLLIAPATAAAVMAYLAGRRY
ncbi:MAG: glycosyltransferase [Candidatus Sabulitectum sp.]|nr:glycosyltransferase [Candidatus Sabulitectum sp.]